MNLLKVGIIDMNMNKSEIFEDKDHSINILLQLNRQRLESHFCDVFLRVEKRKFPAHRNVLVASSEYFRILFAAHMKEKNEKTIFVKGITPRSMDKILTFIYTTKISFTEDDVAEILQAASSLRVINLMELAKHYLVESLNTGNCLKIKNLAGKFSLRDVEEEAGKYILDNFEEISLQAGFGDLQLVHLEKHISADELSVTSEQVIYNAIVRWVKHDLKNRVTFFPRLFKHVRLQLIDTDYLAEHIRKEPLVRESHECRDLVEDALLFYVNPKKQKAQTPRSISSSAESASVILFSDIGRVTAVYDVQKRLLKDEDLTVEIPTNTFGTLAHGSSNNIALCGGLDHKKRPSRDVAFYDGKVWKSLPKMNARRNRAAAAFIEKKLYVFGGEGIRQMFMSQLSLSHQTMSYNNDYEVYNDKAGKPKTWTVAGKLNTSRCDASAVTVDDGRVYLIGGYIPVTHQLRHGKDGIAKTTLQEILSSSVDIYNQSSNKWEIGPTMNEARALFGASLLDSRIYVVGGITRKSRSTSSSEFLDISAGPWTKIVQKIQCNLGPTSSCCVQNEIFVLGNNVLLRLESSKKWIREGKIELKGKIAPFYLNETHRQKPVTNHR